MSITGIGNTFDRGIAKNYNHGRADEMKTIVKKVVGIILIIAGLVALLTPLTPGSWLALIGLELLGVRLLIERKLLNEKQRAAVDGIVDKFMQKFKLASGRQNGSKTNNKKG